MNKHGVCRLLMDHYEETGKEMSAIQLIIACGNETDPDQLLEGHKMFQHLLLNQRKKSA